MLPLKIFFLSLFSLQKFMSREKELHRERDLFVEKLIAAAWLHSNYKICIWVVYSKINYMYKE